MRSSQAVAVIHVLHRVFHIFKLWLSLHSQQLGGMVNNSVNLWERQLFQLLGIRRGDLSTSDSDGRRLQVIEAIFTGKCHDLCTNAEGGEVGADTHHSSRLLHRLDNSLDIEGLDGSEVDDFAFNTVLRLELFGGIEGQADVSGEGNNAEVLSWSLDLGFAKRNDKVGFLSSFRHGEGLAVKQSIFH